MISPTKHISVQNSLLGAGAVVLRNLSSPQPPTALWERVRRWPEIKVFERFVLTLDFLFAIGAVELEDGLIVRTKR
jgi:hypothetical protein